MLQSRDIWRRLLRAVRAVLASEIGTPFKLLGATLIALLLGTNGLNVVNSYVGRDLVTSIEQRSPTRFVTNALLWALVFAGLTLVAVLERFIEERLALLWREWLTKRLVSAYLHGGSYLSLKEHGQLGNPDQRISDDARAFTATTLSFMLMLLNATFVVIAFSGVLWSISPTLFLVAIAYAALGSLCTILVGRSLVRLNYDQSDCEASFRAELVHVGEHAESIALQRFEGRLARRLRQRLALLVANLKRIIAVNRSVGLSVTGYNYGIQLLPPLVVGPLFMQGKVEFGVITQSAMAFAQLLGAFSLIINQFSSISSYAAVLVRLGAFSAALEASAERASEPAVDATGTSSLIYDDLTLLAQGDGECVVAHLTLTITSGTHLLITGTDEARRALFRATALGRDIASGRCIGPGRDRLMFLPERPYVPAGTLRELVLLSGHEAEVSDHEVCAVLADLGLGAMLTRVGGLDVERDYSHALSLAEQQLLAVARVVLAKATFVMLQNPTATLSSLQLSLVLSELTRAGVTYLVLEPSESSDQPCDALLELKPGGGWQVTSRSRGPEASAR